MQTLSKELVAQCVEKGVGTLVVGDLGDILDDAENGEPRNWGNHGNLDLHGWAFDCFTQMLHYKAKPEGITVDLVSERGTSTSCSAFGHTDRNQRVERGLYVCEACDTVANADTNGAETIRQKVLPSPPQDRDNGWLAQPVVRLFDRSEGVFAPREQVSDREP